MYWRSISYLWLLAAVVAVAALLVLALRRRRELLKAFAELNLIDRLTPDVDERRRWVRIALRLTVLGFITIALAGPKWGFHWEEVKRQGIDLIVAIDTSRSMLATDVKPNRLERAKLAVLDLVQLLEGRTRPSSPISCALTGSLPGRSETTSQLKPGLSISGVAGSRLTCAALWRAMSSSCTSSRFST